MNVSIINNSNSKSVPIKSAFVCVIIMVKIATGITIIKVFDNILAESLLVAYSSSISIISSLRLNFNMYLLSPGVLAYVKYNF